MLFLPLVASCKSAADAAFGDLAPLPAFSWASEVQNQCVYGAGHFDALACSRLADCVENEAAGTLLSEREMKNVYRQLVPSSPLSNNGASIADIRANADGLGPEGLALFAAMETTRRTCLNKTGLAKYVADN